MLKTGIQPTSTRPFTGWHTSASDGYSHAVTDEAFAVGARQGKFEAVCGLVIWLAASVAPCGRDCPRCAALVQAHITRYRPPGDIETLGRGLGWLRWTIHRRERGIGA